MGDTSFFDAALHDEKLRTESARQDAANAAMRPSTLYRPVLTRDGDMYCALYGENLHEGCAGFGKTPEAAFENFDVNWKSEIPVPPAGHNWRKP